MDDHRSDVEQDPGAVGVAFLARDASVVRSGGFDDRIGDGAGLDLGPSGDDGERVREDRPRADLERDELLTFFFERRVAHDFDQFGQWKASCGTPNVRPAAAVCGATDIPCFCTYRTEASSVARMAAERSRWARAARAARSGKSRPGSRPSAR